MKYVYVATISYPDMGFTTQVFREWKTAFAWFRKHATFPVKFGEFEDSPESNWASGSANGALGVLRSERIH